MAALKEASRAEKLTFSRRLFNPNFYHLVTEMRDTSRRFIFPYGGSSSAKTFSTVQGILIQGNLVEKSNTIVFRKVSATIRKSIKKDFERIIKDYGLEYYFEIQDFTIKCYNGSFIDFSGMDDSEKIKGISSYKRVMLEELSEFEFKDFKQVRKRLRGIEGQQIISCFNPIDVDHWINTEVFDKEVKNGLTPYLSEIQTSKIGFNGLAPLYTAITEKWEGAPVIVKGVTYPPNFVVMKSTYLNNFWIVGAPCKTFGFFDVQTIADFEKDKDQDWDFYNIYGLGNWGKLTKGGEIYKKFLTKKHVKPVRSYDPEKSLHITLDENVNPYLTLNVHQSEGLSIWQIDEICLEDPRNSLSETLKEFKERYPVTKASVFVYGDATSKKADTKLEKGQNFFTLVENFLEANGYIYTRRVPASNPSVSVRTNWLNTIFAESLDEISVEIGDNCTKTINDYQYCKTASDGTKHKEKAKHPVTKVVFEKYGHTTDANDYLYCEYFAESFANFVSPQGDFERVVRKKIIKKRY
jgi:phage terminase large subunit